METKYDKNIKFLKNIKAATQAMIYFLELNIKADFWHCEEQKKATIDAVVLQKATLQLINQEIEMVRLADLLN